MWDKVLSGALATFGLGATVFSLRKAPEPPTGAPHAIFSRQGRDLAFVGAVRAAKRSIYLRTNDLSLVAFVNELGQAVQNGVEVRVELPMTIGPRVQDLATFLMQVGARVEIATEPWTSYQGAYLQVDGGRFLYSAQPMVLSPGVPISYAEGRP